MPFRIPNSNQADILSDVWLAESSNTPSVTLSRATLFKLKKCTVMPKKLLVLRMSVQISDVKVKCSTRLSLDLTNADKTSYLLLMSFVIVCLDGTLYIGTVFCTKNRNPGFSVIDNGRLSFATMYTSASVIARVLYPPSKII